MTSRQNKIYEAIRTAYRFVEDVDMNDDIYDIHVIYETFREAAANEELKSVHQIAVFFFLGLKIFGTSG